MSAIDFGVVLHLLSFHAPVGEPLVAFNRLLRKAVALRYGDARADGVPHHGEGDVAVREASLTVKQAAGLVPKKTTETPPYDAAAPIIVAVWQGEWYLLDGRRRLSLWSRSAEKGRVKALIVTCGRSAARPGEAAERFQRKFCKPAAGRALVVGSKVIGRAPDRRRLFVDAVGLDAEPGRGVDIVHDLEEPADIGTFAHVDCVSVLDRVRRPWRVAENIERLLDLGGTIFVSVPWVWRGEEPGDCWRMTREGLKTLFPGIEWAHIAFATDTGLMDTVPSIASESGQVWFARSELLAFGVRCAF